MLRKFWIFGPVVGFAIAASVTIVITIWEWIENPSGIFHGPEGTNWRFVYDTAASWFIPTWLQATVAATALHLAWAALKRLSKGIRGPAKR